MSHKSDTNANKQQRHPNTQQQQYNSGCPVPQQMMQQITRKAIDISRNLGMGNSQDYDNIDPQQMSNMMSHLVGGMIDGDNNNTEFPSEFPKEFQKQLQAGVGSKSHSSKNKKKSKSESKNKISSTKTKDIHYSLEVELEDVYSGKVKKISVKRKRLDIKTKKYGIEKKVLRIPVEPGMEDGQMLRFRGESDEAVGKEPGDVLVTLEVIPHSIYERVGNHLLMEKEISISDSYGCEFMLTHLDGRQIRVKTCDGEVLHRDNSVRKIKGEGMPVFHNNKRGDMFVRFNIVLPENLDDDRIQGLRSLISSGIPKILETDLCDGNCIMEALSDEDYEEIDDEDFSSSDDEFSSSSCSDSSSDSDSSSSGSD